jgi:Mrp family chromosome partitioning ATPase
VVDADYEHPSLARACGIADHAGWGDVLDEQLALGDALIAAVEDHITLMPWRGEPKSSSRLHSSRAATTFGMLRDHYDLVLLDTMPLGESSAIDDFARFAKAVQLDALYLLHDVRSTAPEALADAWPQLRRSGVNVEGIIENFVAPKGGGRAAGPKPSKSVADQPLAA